MNSRWRLYFEQMQSAVALETILKPTVIEHSDGLLASTACTDVEESIIHLDISQSPLKTALSLAYELKNMQHQPQYSQLNADAKNGSINKSEYINAVLRLEAEAAYFRCKVFIEIGEKDDSLFPFNKEYLSLYRKTLSSPLNDILIAFKQYIQENAVVRKSFAVKKYYSDCYEFYSGKKGWPSFYDEIQSRTPIICVGVKPVTQISGETQNKKVL